MTDSRQVTRGDLISILLSAHVAALIEDWVKQEGPNARDVVDAIWKALPSPAPEPPPPERYSDVPGPLTRSGHPKAEKAALHDALAHKTDPDGFTYLPATHQVFDALQAAGFTIVRRAAQPAPDPETWSGRVDLRDRLVAALDRGHEDGTLLVTAYRYPDGATDEGVALTHFGLIEDLLARSFLSKSGGSGGEAR